MKKETRKISPIIIRGESEFSEAFGIKDPRTQAALREKGLPCMHDGAMYVYDPQDVLAWMKTNWKIFK
jgi:hypothetical protein